MFFFFFVLLRFSNRDEQERKKKKKKKNTKGNSDTGGKDEENKIREHKILGGIWGTTEVGTVRFISVASIHEIKTHTYKINNAFFFLKK